MNPAMNNLLYFLNIFSGRSWQNLGRGFMAWLGRVVYRVIIIAIGRVCDICQMIFKKMAGISDTGVRLNGETIEGDIVLAFIKSSIVKKIFVALLILAVVVLLVTSFAATIKTEFAKDGNNNKKKVIKNAFRGLANFVLVPVICIFALIFGNILLRAIDGATGTDNMVLSSQVFLAGGYNANRARMSENNGSNRDAQPYIAGSFGAMLVGRDNKSGYGNFGLFYDDPVTSRNPYRAADKIDAMFSRSGMIVVANGTGRYYYSSGSIGFQWRKVWSDDGGGNGTETVDSARNSATISFAAAGIWYDGAFGGDLGVNCLAATSNTEVTESTRGPGDGEIKFNNGDIISFNLYNVGLIYYYYDLNIGSFGYLISAVSLLFCAYTLLIVALGLIKRLFTLATLFIISAPICAIYPLDDGAALGRWRGEFIKQTLSAYSVVVVMNIFFILSTLVLKLDLFVSQDFLSGGVFVGFANYFARVLITIGGLVFFKDATAKIAEIIGSGNAHGDGSSNAKGFIGGIKRTAAGVGVAAGTVGAAGKLAVGAGDIVSSSYKGLGQGLFNKNKKSDTDDLAKNDAAGEDGKLTEKPPAGSGNNSMNASSKGDSGSKEDKKNKENDKNKWYTGDIKRDSLHLLQAGGHGLKTVGKRIADSTPAYAVRSLALKAKDSKFGKGVASFAKKTGIIFSAMASEVRDSKFGRAVGFTGKLVGKTVKYGAKTANAVGGAVKSGAIAGYKNLKPIASGLGDSISGIVGGNLTVKDATKWSKGSRATQKKLKENSDKAKGAQKEAKDKEEQRSYERGLHEADRAHQDELQRRNEEKIHDLGNSVDDLKETLKRINETLNKNDGKK